MSEPHPLDNGHCNTKAGDAAAAAYTAMSSATAPNVLIIGGLALPFSRNSEQLRERLQVRIVGAGDFGSATNCERMKSGWSLGIKADCTIHFNSTVCGATPMAFGVLGCSQTNTVRNNKRMQAHYLA